MTEGGSKQIGMKKDETPLGQVRTLSQKHVMAEGGSKLIEMKRVRTLGKKHQGARSQEAKFANQAHTKGKR